MQDDKNVQTEGASAEEQTSTESTETQAQPSIEEQIAKAMGEQAETISRKIQSATDKAIGRIQREADTTAKMTEDAMAALDATTGEEPAVATPKRQDQYRSQLDTRRQQEAAIKQTVDAFESNIRQHITDLGIDPDNKGIEWGESDNLSLTDRQGKILASVSKIQKENAKLAEQQMIQKAEDRFKELDQAFRKEHGLDSVDTTTSAGAGSTSDAEFLDKFGTGEVPFTKANKERAEKLMK